MSESRKTVLVVGSTGSIGHLVVEEAVRQGYVVRALVRTPSKARRFPAQVEVIFGDVTRPETLNAAVAGVDGIVFTLGSDGEGNRRHAGDPSDGVISRRQIAEVLVQSLRSESALRKSFELIAAKGPAQENLDALFASLDADTPRSLDAVKDTANMPLEDEPQRVRDDLNAVLDLT